MMTVRREILNLQCTLRILIKYSHHNSFRVVHSGLEVPMASHRQSVQIQKKENMNLLIIKSIIGVKRVNFLHHKYLKNYKNSKITCMKLITNPFQILLKRNIDTGHRNNTICNSEELEIKA